MRRIALVAAVLATASSVSPALADCSEEVKAAFVAQNQKPFLRKDTRMISENGLVNMTLEFQLPDRMRQVVSLVTDPKPVETIVVGKRAWTQDENGWFELPMRAAEQVVEFMDKSIGQNADVGKFECLGAQSLDGQQVRAYRGIDEGPKDLSKNKEQEPPKNEAVRLVYLDVATGLPARSIYAHKDRLDTPIYKEVYSFPDKLNIDPPANVQKQELINPVKPLEEQK
jgi:hypothetical protein